MRGADVRKRHTRERKQTDPNSEATTHAMNEPHASNSAAWPQPEKKPAQRRTGAEPVVHSFAASAAE
jgi:hypothetical protein